jgi:hypothetical protein
MVVATIIMIVFSVIAGHRPILGFRRRDRGASTSKQERYHGNSNDLRPDARTFPKSLRTTCRP